MRKYKTQTLICIAGLAMGFTCFALSALWIRYEMTYDSFHRDADRIYCTYLPNMFSKTGTSKHSMPAPLAAYLKETFPEIEEAMAMIPSYPNLSIEIQEMEYHPAYIVHADSIFLSFFGVRIVEGSRDFLIPDSKKMAITQEKARQLFGREDPVGKTIKYWQEEYTICAVVTGLPRKSNYRFDMLLPLYPVEESDKWYVSRGENILLKLMPGIDAKAFEKKLNEHEFKVGRPMKGLTLKLLTQVRYTDLEIIREVKFQHILIFALSGSLLIICSLFNYLTLFVSRFRMRQKEMALRMVCGASKWSLFALLSVEFALSLCIALLFGLLFIQLLHAPFQKLSEIQLELSAIFGEVLLYLGTVIVGALVVFQLILALFHRRTLQAAIRHSNKNQFRSMSIIVQLIISIGFIFCAAVILKQMYYLHHTDLGFTFKDRGAITAGEQEALANKIREIPEIREILQEAGPLLPVMGRMGTGCDSWDEKPENAESITMEMLNVSERYLSFYEFRLIAGELLHESDADSVVLINEAAQKAFGWKDAIGKRFNNCIVKGVVKDIYNFAPTVSAKPFYYCKNNNMIQINNTLLFRYEPDKWNICRRKIEKIIQELYPNNRFVYLSNTEEEYDKFLQSENALLKLLGVVSFACIAICVFGFFSLISLTCEERRKEIVIRKINGATVRDILDIFFKENALLLLIGAAIAFAGGYHVMQRWLEQYVKQTTIPLWIYVSIVSVMALVIVLCVGWRVYRASVENPAEVIKSE
jgi:hypothetical protein